MKQTFMKIAVGLFVAGPFILTGCAKSPSACFSLPHDNPFKVGENIKFDASCSKDARFYTWYFKDGQFSDPNDNPVIYHAFWDSGAYLVKLRAEGKGSKEEVKEIDVIDLP